MQILVSKLRVDMLNTEFSIPGFWAAATILLAAAILLTVIAYRWIGKNQERR